MDEKLVRKGDIVAKSGGTVENIWFIADGSIQMKAGPSSVNLGKGDFLGLADISTGTYSCDYIAESDCHVRMFSTRDNLLKSDFLSAKPDNCRAVAVSVNRIAQEIYSQLEAAYEQLSGLLELTQTSYSKYCEYAVSLHTSPSEIDGVIALPEQAEISVEDRMTGRMHAGMSSYLANRDLGTKLVEDGIVSGYIMQCSADIDRFCPAIRSAYDTLKDCVDILMNESEDDLYGRLLTLYIRATSDHALAPEIMSRIDEIYDRVFDVDPRIAEIRRAYSDNRLSQINKASGSGSGSKGTNLDIISILHDSMSSVFGYAGFEGAPAESMRNAINRFKKLSDPFSSEDDAKLIRKTIEDNFYILYLSVLEQVVTSSDQPPVIIRMFLNFGYLDEELAGIENACELYNLALTFEGDSKRNVYTIYEWLLAILRREKEPSINEFEQNWDDYLKEQRDSGNLTDAKVNALKDDRAQKVIFELKNMFRRTSKICSGQILAFCPVFCEYQLIRPVREDLCDANRIINSIKEIRKIDFSVFFRETMCVFNEKDGIYDTIHVEVLPDIILVPVVGNRAVMWQEICGKDRLTPARFVFPVINTEDITKLTIKILGEFRWELCKRIQGARWNDVTDPSITSLYSDYLQFYRKNSELSAEQKEKVKTGLQRFKQVYKDYFVNDYSEYIRFESAGSPHLNKVARYILFTQCPFSASIREKLNNNPIYVEVSDRLRVKNGQQLHKLENISKKIKSRGLDLPRELKNEIAYYNL